MDNKPLTINLAKKMSKISKEEITKKYEQLPENVRKIFSSTDTSRIIRDLGQKHKLMLDKIGELADETGLVMLGLTHPKNFISNLTSRLGATKEVAREIADEINEKIFQKIRSELRQIHKISNSTESEIVKSEIKTAKPSETLGQIHKTQGPKFKIQDLKQGLKKEVDIPAEKVQTEKSVEKIVSPEAKVFTTAQKEAPEKEPPTTSLKKVAETTTLPTIVEQTPKPPEAVGQTSSDISPFEHKTERAEVFKAPAEISKHKAPSYAKAKEDMPEKELGGKAEKAVKNPELMNGAYKNKDPYREPIN